MKHYTTGVSIQHLSWNEAYITDMLTDRGFEIYELAYQNDKNNIKNKHGIMSTEFCTDWSDDDAFRERYRCKCGYLQGKAFDGEYCDVCHTKVKYKDVDYTKFGWISLNGYSIIQPNYYNLLESLIGANHLKEILAFEKELDLDGQDVNDPEKFDKDHPFKGLGMLWFKSHLREVVHFYLRKKKNKEDLANFILLNRDEIFASHIPVYSSVLRPELMTKETYNYFGPNTIYNNIVSISRTLYDVGRMGSESTEVLFNVENALVNIQTRLMHLNKAIFDTLKGKDGVITSSILGGALSYTSRCVIIPDSTLRADEVDLPYIAFLEIFKFEIIGHICEIKNITYSDAANLWNKACIAFNDEVYEIMTFIIDKYSPQFIINRNPTINYGSLLCMKVRKVSKDYDNYSMSLPISVLKVYNADFDGDVLNILSLKTQELKEKYTDKFSPIYNLFVSRLDGKFNRDADLLKDQSIGIWDFANYTEDGDNVDE